MKVIHDRYYSTPPATFTELRLRLQLIAEEEVGRHVRDEAAQEDAVAAMNARVVHGSR